MAFAEERVNPDTKEVGKIKGQFHVPSYQRGYRWGKEEVTRLLDDLFAACVDSDDKLDFCLQPIVVRCLEKDQDYELIDGQQRLTTIYLVYKYLQISSENYYKEPRFSLEYETRSDSALFLSSIDKKLRDKNVDFWHMCNAYDVIEGYLKGKEQSEIALLNIAFDRKVKVIWYEIDEDQNPIKLFTRLNIGKIPLTNSELVKALFLSAGAAINERKQDEIAMQWDAIERELNNQSLWSFLSNSDPQKSQTKIDLILDLMANKAKNRDDPYCTFFYFDQKRKEKDLSEIWTDIQRTFLLLKGWYEDHDLYHYIGYLIASGLKSLGDIYAMSENKAKDVFCSNLVAEIGKSLKPGTDYAQMSYDKDHKELSRLLLLFNVESVRTIDGKSRRFPFDNHKLLENGGMRWTLEHIHAQQSRPMNKQEDWRKWLEEHAKHVRNLSEEGKDLADEMETALQKANLKRNEFIELQERAIEALSPKGGSEYIHSLSNMALLDAGSNTALGNSVFAVKRDKIIQMDRAGLYIPFCTRMVYLKYYAPSEGNQLAFWGLEDRRAYIAAINEKLEGLGLTAIPFDEEDKR